ncbi:unnamed protein product [Symbiodinium natans]|uniref:Sulfite exporter TauE/SafE n=1 Tax=Symbiodinium natans TaxID=878477 RepID=A0A812T826_9DINO|nr:unnamed protein product [Symbiodinium natans]
MPGAVASHGRWWTVAAGLSRVASAHDGDEGSIALAAHASTFAANLSTANSSAESARRRRRGGNPFRGSPIWTPGSEIDCSETCGSWRDCSDWPMRMCALDDYCDKHVCLHKRLFPMLGGDASFFFVIFIVAFLAGAPGIGGGGINVPLLMMLNRFTIKEAVPISHIAVMGNALSQLLVNTRLRHPSMPLRPLIHYEVAAVLLPAMLGGNSLGIVVSRVVAPTLLVVLSLALLLMTSCKTFYKGVKAYREQSRKSSTGSISLQRTFLNFDLHPRSQSVCSDSVLHGRNARSGRRLQSSFSPPEPPLDKLPMRIPWKAILFMIAFNIIFCIDYLVMAPDVFGVERCSVPYWIALLALYPVVAASVLVAVRFIRRLDDWHEQRGDGPIEGDPAIGRNAVLTMPLLATVVGLLAGLLGLGGGEFLVPLLLEFGTHPRVAAATSGFLIFFNTSSNVVHYLLAGTIEPFISYGIGCFLFAMFGSLCGLLAGNTRYVKEHSYLIIFLVAVALFASAILLVVRGFSEVSWSFAGFCPP